MPSPSFNTTEAEGVALHDLPLVAALHRKGNSNYSRKSSYMMEDKGVVYPSCFCRYHLIVNSNSRVATYNKKFKRIMRVQCAFILSADNI